MEQKGTELECQQTAVEQVCREQVFGMLKVVARAIAQTLGTHCEVVVHDFADLEHSIVAVEGNLTERKVGGALTDLGLSVLTSNPSNTDVLTYKTQAPNGRKLKSTSALLRNADNEIFGALCINIDAEAASQALNFLSELLHIPETSITLEEHFLDDPAEVIAGIVSNELTRQGRQLKQMKREERVDLIQALLDRGVFNMRNAPTIVANLIGVSRFTIYNYINAARPRTVDRG